MFVKLLSEHHLEFLSLKGGYTCSSESTLVKMSNCWQNHALAHIFLLFYYLYVSVATSVTSLKKYHLVTYLSLWNAIRFKAA